MTSPAEQSALDARLHDVLGAEPAATLMTMLPGGDHLATKTDLVEARSELKADIAAVRSEVAALWSELKEELREIRTMIRGYDEALRSYVRTFVVAKVATVVGVTGIVLGTTRMG